MRFVHLYLTGYFVLIVGAAMALSRAGVLGRLPPTWVVVGSLVSVGLGIMLAVTAVRPTVTR